VSSENTQNDFEDVILGATDAVDEVIFRGPERSVLGGAEPDVSLKQIRLRIGRRPTVRKLRRLYDVLGIKYPADLELFNDYEVWLFAFQLHLLKDGGFSSVRKLGCQVKFPEDAAVSIVSQMPDSDFVSWAGGKVSALATLSATGRAEVPVMSASVGAASAEVGGGIKAEVAGDAHVNLSFSVMTDKVIATGTGDCIGEWAIKKQDEPLLGEQHFLSAVLVPKGAPDLTVGIRAYVEVGTAFFVSTLLKSEWVNIDVSLDGEGHIGTEQSA
jgi:hypothetical protein